MLDELKRAFGFIVVGSFVGLVAGLYWSYCKQGILRTYRLPIIVAKGVVNTSISGRFDRDFVDVEVIDAINRALDSGDSAYLMRLNFPEVEQASMDISFRNHEIELIGREKKAALLKIVNGLEEIQGTGSNLFSDIDRLYQAGKNLANAGDRFLVAINGMRSEDEQISEKNWDEFWMAFRHGAQLMEIQRNRLYASRVMRLLGDRNLFGTELAVAEGSGFTLVETNIRRLLYSVLVSIFIGAILGYWLAIIYFLLNSRGNLQFKGKPF